MDELHVELTGVVQSSRDGLFGDLVKHHPLHRHLGCEQLQQVPADAFAFPVFDVSRQQQLVDPFQCVLELPHHLLLVLRDHIQGFEVSLSVDAEVGPFLPFVSCRNLTCVVGQVAHMAHRGFHPVPLGEETTDGAGLGGALDDDQGVRHRREVTVLLYRTEDPTGANGGFCKRRMR